jgi:hypothetical protein
MVISPTTFGDSKACIILVDMMNKGDISPKESRKVLCFINRVSTTLAYLQLIPDRSYFDYVYDIYKLQILDNPKPQFSEYPLIFRTHLNTALSYLFKKSRRQYYEFGPLVTITNSELRRKNRRLPKDNEGRF